jgi:hypothetical protein
MAKRVSTSYDYLEQINAWFERHKLDRSPPNIWPEYFEHLLDLALLNREQKDAVDPASLEDQPR